VRKDSKNNDTKQIFFYKFGAEKSIYKD
jgi:hypothetical protein